MKYRLSKLYMLAAFLAAGGLFLSRETCAAKISFQAIRLQAGHTNNPLGIDVKQPVLGWQIVSADTNVLQSAYQVVVSTSARKASFGKGDIWDSGKVISSESFDVPYVGPALKSGCRYFWSVKVWDNHGHRSNWASARWWEMGLLTTGDWSGARWIAAAEASQAAPLLRAEFSVAKRIARARLYISAAGYYVASINGQRIGDAVLDPGFVAFDHRSLYATYDVTGQLRRGTNAIGVCLGRGGYAIDTSQKILWWNAVKWLNPQPKLLVKLDLLFTDNTHEIVVSGSDWKTHNGPTTSGSLYRGETYDGRLELAQWNTSGCDVTGWRNARIVTAPTTNLQAQIAEPIRVVSTMKAISITQPKPGIYVYKFPVMTAGWARLTVAGPAGTKVSLRLGETLNQDGTVNNLGDPGLTPGEIQRYEYTLAGRGTEVWEPQFSYAGFQYVQLEHFPGTPTTNSVIACEGHSDVPVIGSFTCSNPLLNAIHDACRRTVLNNLHSIPTDCPMFEKRGWTADALLSAQASDNFGMDRFFDKWMYDLADTQTGAGEIADVAPGPDGSLDPSWTSAFVVIPWRLYQEYGDRTVIATHYDQIKRYVDYLSAKSVHHLVTGFYGDWVSPGYVQPPEGPDLVAGANYYRDVRLLSEMAGILGRTADELTYSNLAVAVKTSFNSVYFDSATEVYRTGKNVGYRQTSSAVPLDFGLVPAGQVAAVVSNLVADVRLHNNHLNTGCFGTAALLPVLTENGQVDLAYAIATQTTYPSWGCWIAHGATTTWEQWVCDASLRSRDHAFLGTVDDWFFKYLAGIQPAAPGYRQITIRPWIPKGLRDVSASIQTALGLVLSSWSMETNGAMTLTVVVPPNATAEVWVPGDSVPRHIGSGRYIFKKPVSVADGFETLNKL